MISDQEKKRLPSVLLVRLSSLGDIVQALPLAFLLHERGHEVAWLVEARFRDLCSLVALPVAWQIWERGWFSTMSLRKLRGKYDLVCDLQGNWKSALCSLAIAGSKSWRPARPNLREASSILIPSRHAEATRAPHVLERSLVVLEAALQEPIDVSRLPKPPFLKAGEESRQRLSNQLHALGIPRGAAFVVQVLGPSGDPRTWPLDQALRLRAQLEVPHVYLAGPAEASLPLPPDLPVLRQEIGSLADLVALGNLLADVGAAAVGHDGGAMHVLRASGAQTLFLFGPQDPARTGPYAEPVLRAPGELPCRPCLSRSCKLPEGNLCMDKIPAEVVRRELERFPDIG